MMIMIKNDPDFELTKPGSFIYKRKLLQIFLRLLCD